MSGQHWVTKTDAVIDQIIDEINGQLGAAGEQEFDFIHSQYSGELSFCSNRSANSDSLGKHKRL